MTAAAYLARDGFEVTALDQADRLGGYLAPFSSGGVLVRPGTPLRGAGAPRPVPGRGAGRAGPRRGEALRRAGSPGLRRLPLPRPRGAHVPRPGEVPRPAGRDLPRPIATGCTGCSSFIGHFAEAGRHWPLAAHSPGLKDLVALRHLPSVLRWVRSSFEELLAHYLHDRQGPRGAGCARRRCRPAALAAPSAHGNRAARALPRRRLLRARGQRRAP